MSKSSVSQMGEVTCVSTGTPADASDLSPAQNLENVIPHAFFNLVNLR